jgi:hypothetical protein
MQYKNLTLLLKSAILKTDNKTKKNIIKVNKVHAGQATLKVKVTCVSFNTNRKSDFYGLYCFFQNSNLSNIITNIH